MLTPKVGPRTVMFENIDAQRFRDASIPKPALVIVAVSGII